jgi:hypothetical protein
VGTPLVKGTGGLTYRGAIARKRAFHYLELFKMKKAVSIAHEHLSIHFFEEG